MGHYISGVVFPNVSNSLLAWTYWLFVSYTAFLKHMYLFLSKPAGPSGHHFSDFLTDYLCGFIQSWNKEFYCIFFLILHSNSYPSENTGFPTANKEFKDRMRTEICQTASKNIWKMQMYKQLVSCCKDSDKNVNCALWLSALYSVLIWCKRTASPP